MGDEEQRINLAVDGRVTSSGEFEVLAITAGVGNGWTFPADALRRSLTLWDGVACYVDHAGFWDAGRSVRDLGGHFSGPEWDEAAQGVRLRLRTGGPSGPLVDALGRELLAEVATGQAGPVGFSADIGFSAKGREVVDILRVFSLDLVVNPARGGAFVRALNQQRQDKDTFGKESCMGDEANVVPAGAGSALAGEVEKAREARAQMCAYLLDSGLVASQLPAAVQERIRKRFAGQVFEAGELQAAIEDGRALVSELTGPAVVQGPAGQVRGVFSSEDQLRAAVADLLDAPRDADVAQMHTARLSGIRELYLMLTGDDELHGGYYPERVRLATTADFAGLIKNALNKIIVNRWSELGRAGYTWWERVAVIEHFNTLQQITGTLVGTVGDLPVVAERGEYPELVIGDSPETADWTKYGGYIPLTLELIDRDETRKLRAYPRELAAAGLRKISALVSALFTANSGIGPTLADGGALFNATAVTSAGGHANLRTVALSAGEWDTVCTAVYNQPMLIKNAAGVYGTGPKMALNPRYLLVPRALQLAGMKILYPSLENAANIYSENQQRGQPGDVIVVPEWSDATDWAAVCDPRLAPAIYIGERFGLVPEVFVAGDNLSPAVFMNDEHRIKVRHFLAVWVNDFRPLHKSNVAG